MLKLKEKHKKPPVITIDGPSGSGKGTITLMLTKHLGWHYLDSGGIYRAIAWAILHYGIQFDDNTALKKLLGRVQIAIEGSEPDEIYKIFCDSREVTQAIRSEECAAMASQVSSYPIVRAAVLEYQRDFRRFPGLVADGRDMGTVVFPDAALKFFIEAEPEQRAMRRYKQLQEQGINVSLRHIQEDLIERDRRDLDRAISPTKPAEDAIVIDTTALNVDQVFKEVLQHVERCFPK